MIGEVQPPGETFLIRIANLGRWSEPQPVTWNVGRLTGLEAREGSRDETFRGGPPGAGEGTAVQLRDHEVGIWIDSDRPRPQLGALIPVCPAYWWWDDHTAPRPLKDAAYELSFAFDLQVPTALREGGAEVYVCAYFLLKDTVSRRAFWLGATLFDLRGMERFPDTVHFDDWEGGTRLPILFTALNGRSAWLHPGPGSAHFTDRPYRGYRHFEFRVSRSELTAAVDAMIRRWPTLGSMSRDPGDYLLTHINVNPEVYAPDGSRGRLGLALRGIRVALVADPTP